MNDAKQPPRMCPKCGGPLTRNELDDEDAGGNRFVDVYYDCPACGSDFESHELPTPPPAPPQKAG